MALYINIFTNASCSANRKVSFQRVDPSECPDSLTEGLQFLLDAVEGGKVQPGQVVKLYATVSSSRPASDDEDDLDTL